MNFKRAKILLLLVTILTSFSKLSCQTKISLDNALLLVKLNSSEYRAIQREYKIEDLEYSIYKNSFLPRADIEVSLPTYNRSINSITQPNGENIFIEQQQANSMLRLNVYQKLPFTGGQLLLSSSVNRLDLFSSDTKLYSSNWFDIFLTQPLKRYNSFKWGKKVNKARFEKKNIALYKKLEDLNKDLIELFCSTYIYQKKIDLTKRNISTTSKYVENANVLFQNGRILEQEVIKGRLSLNQLLNKLESEKINYSNSLFRLKHMIGVNPKDSILLIEPEILEKPIINSDVLSDRIRRFSLDYGFRLDLLQSEQELAKAKSNKGLQADLQIGYGLNSNNNEFSNLYEIPSRRKYLNFGLNIPLINWNENGKRYQIEQLKNENLKEFYDSEKNRIELQVSNYVQTLNSLFNKIQYTRQNMGIAEINSNIASEKLILNRLTINEYDIEILKQDQILVEFLDNIKSLWINRYFLRKVTLYDFFQNETLFIE